MVMDNNNLNQIVVHCQAIEKLLEEYGVVTDLLLRCETENSDEIDRLIAQRQELIEYMEIHRLANTELIDSEDRQTAEAIRSFFSGTSNGRIGERLMPVHNAAVNLRSAQAAAAEKEKTLQLQFTSRYNEIKDKLEKLRDDKKKIDFYSAMKSPSAVGYAFDSRS